MNVIRKAKALIERPDTVLGSQVTEVIDGKTLQEKGQIAVNSV